MFRKIENKPEILEFIQSGMPMAEITSTYGISENCYRNWKRSLEKPKATSGKPKRTWPAPLPADRKAAALDALKKGAKQLDVARQFGISPSWVCRLAKNLGASQSKAEREVQAPRSRRPRGKSRRLASAPKVRASKRLPKFEYVVRLIVAAARHEGLI